jgi:S-adenosylmethionine synthetase
MLRQAPLLALAASLLTGSCTTTQQLRRPATVESLQLLLMTAGPVSVLVDTSGTGNIPDDKMVDLVRGHFQLTPRGIIESLDLRRPIYRKTAAFGHFGRSEPEFTWERADKAQALKAAAGL